MLGAVVLFVLVIGGGLIWYFAAAPEWNEAGFKLLCRETLGEPMSEAWERLDGERTFLPGCVTDRCRELNLGGQPREISCPDERCFALFQSADAVCRLTVDPRLPVVQEVDTFWQSLVRRDGLPAR